MWYDDIDRDGRIGELPYFRWSGAGGVGGRLTPSAQAELGEDVADVVFDRLATDEQAIGDLRIGQAVAEQVEHLDLAFGQMPRASSRGVRGADAERSQHCRRCIGVASGRSRPNASSAARASVIADIGPLVGERVGQLEPRVCHLDRHLRPRESGQGLAEHACGSPVPCASR